MDSRRRKLNSVKDQHSSRQSKKQTSGKELIRCVLNPFINVLYNMPVAGKLSVGDSVPAAAKLA